MYNCAIAMARVRLGLLTSEEVPERDTDVSDGSIGGREGPGEAQYQVDNFGAKLRARLRHA
jgi:hypothetical protein